MYRLYQMSKLQAMQEAMHFAEVLPKYAKREIMCSQLKEFYAHPRSVLAWSVFQISTKAKTAK